MNVRLQKRCLQIAETITPTIRDIKSSHVAFLIKGSKIIKIGWNKRKTHPRVKYHPYHAGFVGLHAEIDVIIKSDIEDFNNIALLVIRIDRMGKISNSKPCCGCQSILNQVGIGEIWYSTVNGIIKYE